MDDLLAELSACSTALGDRPAYVLSDAEVVAAHASLRVEINRLTAIDAAFVHDIDGRGIVRASGSANVSTWLRDHSRMSIGEAHKLAAARRADALSASECAVARRSRDPDRARPRTLASPQVGDLRER